MAPTLDDHPKPLVIVGPTASGKTALALAVARRLAAQSSDGFEIVSADAMAIYRDMDVGTAKPSPAERAEFRHHGIDLVDPTEDYTVAQYQQEATAAMAAITARGNTAIVVGGTGLYVRALVDDFTMPGQFPEVRADLEAEADTTVLWDRLVEADPVAATKMLSTNRRRIVRALEVTVGSGRPFSSFGPGVDHYPEVPYVLAGVEIDRAVLDSRIDERYDRQLEAGFLDEVADLVGTGLSRTAAQALGYRELADHLAGRCTLDEALIEARRRTKKFARRQQRWFRRDPRIRWFPSDADDLVDQVIDHWNR